ncbi:MAG TPA: hemolysin family protein [Anaerolineaceae bacterium]|jgi:putative hemolysin|nr:hemolysin family protein [Anaerolineaceae bacterium]HPT23362.1 hemolysin family protein [Anaerolineaceae bacterium]
MPIYINILIILVLFYFNAIFAMYEIAMVAARKTRLQQSSEEGVKGATYALELLQDTNQQYLSTVQIMITLIDTLAGGIGGALLAEPLARLLGKVSWLAASANTIALILVVVAITYFSIVLGELIPKRLAVSKPEKVVIQLSPTIRVMTKIFRPLTKLLATSTNLGLKVLRINTDAGPVITEDEIQAYIEQGRDIGVIEETEKDMFSGIFRLSERRVDALMTPHTEVVWIDLEDSREQIIHELTHSEYSRIPAARGDLDEVVGMINIKELVGVDLHSPDFQIAAYIREPLFVPENLPALKAFEKFRETGIHQALVIDEYGGVQGMVTLYDVLEAIVGSLPADEFDQEQEAVQRPDGSWSFDGLIAIDELVEMLDLPDLTEEERAGYQTLSGLVMNQLGSVPTIGETFTLGKWRFEVIDMDGRRVDRVLAMPLPDTEPDPKADKKG